MSSNGGKSLITISSSLIDTVRKRLTRTRPLLTPLRAYKPLATNDIAAIVPVRNDAPFLPAFLRHYRSLGVDRFLIVDDQSEDGSVEYLSAQSDVDLFFSEVRFRESLRGRLWRNELIQRYGRDRWYVSVDSDEYLVYADMQRHNVHDLARWLQRGGAKRLSSFMLDFYPPRRLSEAEYIPGTPPWELADHFDRDGYRFESHRMGWKITGGVRERLFQLKPVLQKYPLLFGDRLTEYYRTIHYPLPYWRNFGPIYSVLAHFKYFADFPERAASAVQDQNYWSNARHYRVQHERVSADPNFTFMGDTSVRFTGPDQLISLGLLQSISW